MSVLMGLWSVPLLWILHEGGHWLTCFVLTRKSLKFDWKLKFGFIPVGTWSMPYGTSLNKRRAIAFSGFGAEFAGALFLPRIYLVLAVIHFMTYPYRHGNGGDFNSYNIRDREV